MLSAAGSPTKVPKPEPRFWTDDGYKLAIKLVEDGAACMSLLSKMVSARASLERKHAYGMRKWIKYWGDKVEEAPSYRDGTLHTAWQCMFGEADSEAATMEDLDRVLKRDVKDALDAWRKKHYPSFLGRSKPVKHITATFDLARKPLIHAKDEMQKAKFDYFQAANECHDLAVSKEKAKQYDTPTRVSDLRKIQTKLEKTEAERDHLKYLYEERYIVYLAALPAYQAAMKAALQEVLDIEKERIIFVRGILETYQHIVNQSANRRLAEADDELRDKVGRIDAESDLAHFARTLRVDEVPPITSNGPEPWLEGISYVSVCSRYIRFYLFTFCIL
jgi:hypothetical protein